MSIENLGERLARLIENKLKQEASRREFVGKGTILVATLLGTSVVADSIYGCVVNNASDAMVISLPQTLYRVESGDGGTRTVLIPPNATVTYAGHNRGNILEAKIHYIDTNSSGEPLFDAGGKLLRLGGGPDFGTEGIIPIGCRVEVLMGKTVWNLGAIKEVDEKKGVTVSFLRKPKTYLNLRPQSQPS